MEPMFETRDDSYFANSISIENYQIQNSYSYNDLTVSQIAEVYQLIKIIEIKNNDELEASFESLDLFCTKYKDFRFYLNSVIVSSQVYSDKKSDFIQNIFGQHSVDSLEMLANSEFDNGLLFMHALVNNNEKRIVGCLEIKDLWYHSEKVMSLLYKLLAVISMEIVVFPEKSSKLFDLEPLIPYDIFGGNPKTVSPRQMKDLYPDFILIDEQSSIAKKQELPLNQIDIDSCNNNLPQTLELNNIKFYKIGEKSFMSYLKENENNLEILDNSISGMLLFGLIQGYIDHHNYESGTSINIQQILENNLISETKNVTESKISAFKDLIYDKVNAEPKVVFQFSELITLMLRELKKYFNLMLDEVYFKVDKPIRNTMNFFIEECSEEIKETFNSNLNLLEKESISNLNSLTENYFCPLVDSLVTLDVDLINMTTCLKYFLHDFISSINDNHSWFKNIFEYFSKESFMKLLHDSSEKLSRKIKETLRSNQEREDGLNATINKLRSEIEKLEDNYKMEMTNSLDLKFEFDKLSREFNAKIKESENFMEATKKENEKYFQLIQEKEQQIFKQQRDLLKYENEIKRNSEISSVLTTIDTSSAQDTLRSFHSILFEFKDCFKKLEQNKDIIFNKNIKESVLCLSDKHQKTWLDTLSNEIEAQLNSLKMKYDNEISTLKHQLNQETMNNIKANLSLKYEKLNIENLTQENNILKEENRKLCTEQEEMCNTISLQMKTIQELEKSKEDIANNLENITLELNDFKTKYRLLEDEFDTSFFIIEGVIVS